MKKLLFAFLLVVSACSSIDCPVENTVSVQYVICNADGTSLALTDSLTITSRGNRSAEIVLNRLANKSAFSLPISYSHPEDVLQLEFFNDTASWRDTVWIKKDDIPHFESVDCSASFFHRLTDVRYTQNYIDSLVMKNSSVDYDTTRVHFHIYPKSSH